MICWMKSIFMITHYFPLKSISSSLSHWHLLAAKYSKGCTQTLKRNQEISPPPLLRFSKQHFLIKLFKAQLFLRDISGARRMKTCQNSIWLSTFYSLVCSELRTWFNTFTPAHVPAPGTIQTKATPPADTCFVVQLLISIYWLRGDITRKLQFVDQVNPASKVSFLAETM